jgi:hypothetical protein
MLSSTLELVGQQQDGTKKRERFGLEINIDTEETIGKYIATKRTQRKDFATGQFGRTAG